MTKKTQLSLREAYTELEKLVSEFEQGELDLETSLPKFKRGLELSKQIKERLEVIENQVIEMKKQFTVSAVADDSHLEE